jgi:hypothetical protein
LPSDMLLLPKIERMRCANWDNTTGLMALGKGTSPDLP